MYADRRPSESIVVGRACAASRQARKGDALIWAADLAHGGKPISQDHTRLSIVTHYCPAEVAPLYFEGAPRRIWRHRSGNRFKTLL